MSSRSYSPAAHAARSPRNRPRCLCLVVGIEIVARLAGTNGGFIVKRMPKPGCHLAPNCPSCEPPPEFSGLGRVLGSAITEDPSTGETTLKLDFSMSRNAGRSTNPAAGEPGNSVGTEGSKLSLGGLLHYLWDQAELTHWQPGFAGKRSWATVRKHLLLAAKKQDRNGRTPRPRRASRSP